MRATRLRYALAAALCAHAALALAIAAYEPHAPDAESSSRPAPEEFFLDQETPEVALPAAEIPSAVAAYEPRAPANAAPRGALARASTTPKIAGAASSVVGAPSAPASDAPASTRTASSWRAPMESGDSAMALRDAIRAGVRQTVTEGAPPENGAVASMRAELNQRDRALGLSPGAPLLSLTRNTVRRSSAPTFGHVRFEFRTDENGVVTAVRVVDASSDRAAWNIVAQTLAAEARARKLSVPRGAHGIAVIIDVSTSVKTASGIDRGESSVSVASPAATGTVKASRAEQPLRFGLVVGPNQIDATMHQGVGDALNNATTPDQRIIVARVVDERAL